MPTQQQRTPSVLSNQLSNMARVRINARLGRERHPMVGLIPRDLLNEIRSRIRAAVGEGYSCVIEATPTRAEKVQVSRGGSQSPGWKVNLLMKVTRHAPTSDALPEVHTTVQVELTELLQEAESVARAAAQRSTQI